MTDKSQIDFSTDQPATQESEKAPAGTEVTYGGYKTVEELVAAHEALKTAQAAPNGEQKTEEQTSQVSKEIPTGESDDAAKEAVQNVGLDWDALNTEFTENGKLSDETYTALESKGLPREAVDTYIHGKQAQADAYDTAVFTAAGGKDDYAALIEWAKTNLSDAEKTAFNEAVTSGKSAVATLAVEGLAARYSAKRGTPPPGLLNGNRTPAGVQPYQSQQEITADMRNPRYKNDPAFREQVTARMRASSL